MPRKGGQSGFTKRTHDQRKTRAKRKARNRLARERRNQTQARGTSGPKF